MKIIHDLKHFEPFRQPISLTIGNFDGLHLGHQFLLKHLNKIAKTKDGESVVVTFENHSKAMHSICTSSQKLDFLEKTGVSGTVLFHFNDDFKKQSAEDFLVRLHETIPFSHLILGHDAKFGKDREGTKEYIFDVAKKLNFDVEYLSAFEVDGQIVSSTLIRSLIKIGDLKKVESLLGRKYSIRNQVITGLSKGKKIGFPTANLDVSNLVLPPLGVYAVIAEFEGRQEKAVANLGLAPTMRQSNIPVLEIHLLDVEENLYGKDLNVVFHGFIRAEKQFANIEELQAQIREDVQTARLILE